LPELSTVPLQTSVADAIQRTADTSRLYPLLSKGFPWPYGFAMVA